MELEEAIRHFHSFRTGDVVLSAGQNIGDLIIFFGRHTTIQHSGLLVWLDKASADQGIIKVVPNYESDDSTILSFLGLAEGKKYDIVKKEKHKGMILYEPMELFRNAPIIYVRPINQNYISDEYVTEKMQQYIEDHHLKTQYAYGKAHIVLVGWLGLDVLGRNPNGILCSENVYNFLNYLCDYPNFRVEEVIQDIGLDLNNQENDTSFGDSNANQRTTIRVKSTPGTKIIPQYKTYKVPDAKDYMYTPDFFASEHNDHPIFEEKEVRVIGLKSEVEATVWHPYFVAFAVMVILIIFVFFVISNYCESCRVNGICMRKL
jgi:hypothetical protein